MEVFAVKVDGSEVKPGIFLRRIQRLQICQISTDVRCTLNKVPFVYKSNFLLEYNAQGQLSYGVTSDISAAGYAPQQYPPSVDTSYGGGYSYPQGQYSATASYQPPVGAYGAVGDPVVQPEGSQGQIDPFKFGSPPSPFNPPQVNQEQSWQSYGNNYGDNSGQYGDNSGQYGNNYGDTGGYAGAQDNTGGYKNSESYSQDYSERGRGYHSRGRGGWGGRGTFRGRRGGNEPSRGHGMGRGTFDSGNGFNRGGSWRGRGRGQYEKMRGRGRGQDGMRGRGRGQDGMRGRGRGQRDGTRGRGRGFDQGSNNMNWKGNNKGGNMIPQCSKGEGNNRLEAYTVYVICLHASIPGFKTT